jgi:hypothetical protein
MKRNDFFFGARGTLKTPSRLIRSKGKIKVQAEDGRSGAELGEILNRALAYIQPSNAERSEPSPGPVVSRSQSAIIK